VKGPPTNDDGECGCGCGGRCGKAGAPGTAPKKPPLRRLPPMVVAVKTFSLPLPFVVAVVVVGGADADADAPATPAPFLADAELLLPPPPPFVVVVDFFPLSFLDSSRKTNINRKG
jgi:hypothetical protein